MNKFIGVKLINAGAMGLIAAEAHLKRDTGYRGLRTEDGDCEGYLVEYAPDGYQAWSPKDVFEDAYRPTDGLTFGLAVEALKLGKKVARAGWNGKGMWLELIKGRDVQIHNHGFGPKNEFDHGWRERCPEFAPWIGMKTADNKFVPWLASQTDVLAEDWAIVD